MPRIRSVHPGLFTDEAFVALSDAAQVFLIGLWTEADDQGVFEWKPLTLRMRLRPTKDGDVEALLAELSAVNAIATYETDGRQYGAIRNFRKYQRPKSPKEMHPISDDFRNYVGLSPPNSEMPPDRPGGDSAKSGNRSAEGGGRREDEGEIPPSEGAPALSVVEDSDDKRLFDSGKALLGKGAGGLIKNLKSRFGIEGSLSLLDKAAGKSDPREWLAATLQDPQAKQDLEDEKWEEDYYRGVL